MEGEKDDRFRVSANVSMVLRSRAWGRGPSPGFSLSRTVGLCSEKCSREQSWDGGGKSSVKQSERNSFL